MLPPPTIPPPPLPPPTFRLPLPPPCMLDEVIPKLAYGGAPDPTEDEGEGEDSAIPLSRLGSNPLLRVVWWWRVVVG
jgi:hypothetical protein